MSLARLNKLALAILILIQAPLLQAQWHERQIDVMTTKVSWEYWLNSGQSSSDIDRELEALFKSVDLGMGRHKPETELSRLNAAGHIEPFVVSSELFEVITYAQQVAELTQGAFDISYLSLGYLYDFRDAQQPSRKELGELSDLMDYRQVVLDSGASTVFFKKKGVRLDLGGVAKGYAVDKAIDLLSASGIRSARVSAGGDMRLLGGKNGYDWVVGIKDPRQPEHLVVRLPLRNLAVSTSGDYERFFIDENGDRVHHIISTKTGRPAKGIQSVTIIGDRAVQTDALSTAVFVMGVEEGLRLINKIDGLDAIIIDQERKMHYSEGLMPPE